MKRIHRILLSSFLLTSLVSCGTTPSLTTSPTSSVTTKPTSLTTQSTPSSPSSIEVKQRAIAVKDFGTLVQGQTVDLSDYISVTPGSSDDPSKPIEWDYEILSDEVSLPVLQTVSSKDLSVLKSKKVELTNPGHAVLIIHSGDLSKLVTFDVKEDEGYAKLLATFKEANYKSYTVNKGFTIDGDNTVTASKATPIFYKGERFSYSPLTGNGIAFHKSNDLGYNFYLDRAGGRDETFAALPNGKYNKVTSLSSFNTTYASLSTYFNSSTLTYSSLLERLYGKDYRFGFPNITSTSSKFVEALTALGIPSTQVINGTTFGAVFIIPKVDESGTISLYIVLSDTSYTTLILAGPYTITSIDQTSIPAVEKFIAGKLPQLTTSATPITTKLQKVSSYTATTKAEYLDLDGNVVADKDLPMAYVQANPAFVNVQKVTEDALETTLFKAINSSATFDHALLKNVKKGSSTRIELYSIDKSGNLKDQGEYESSSSSGWKGDSSLNSANPSLLFRDSNFLNIAFWVNSDGSYLTGPINNLGTEGTINALMAGLVGSLYSNDSSAYNYFASNSVLHLDIGKTSTDDVTGDIRIRFAYSDERVYTYHFSFTISDINQTVIETK